MIPHDTDHAALIGAFPFRRLPDPTPRALLAQMDRHGIARAWVGHVPSVWYRDVAAGNDELLEALEPHAARLLPVPAVNPAWPGWERELERARAARCPAVRTYPPHMGFATAGPAMASLAAACAERGLTLVLTVRFEDPRQRSRLDVAPDLIGADIRAAVRSHEAVRLLVIGADRAIVEEVHWGSTPLESARISWDISGIWGAPDEHLSHLVRTIGAERFVFGTHFPFRLHELAIEKLVLSEDLT
jgi:predicted TIM-barrel fold metal-dependent hydrolase